MKKILIVAAHPDDEVLGCFGTVAKMLRRGGIGYTLILSGGKTSRDNSSKDDLDLIRQEAQKANQLIGIKDVSLSNFPDNAFDSVPLLNIVKEIEKIKNEIKPDIIFTHHLGDINIDHQITHKAVLTAARPIKDESVKTIYSMEIPSSTEWNSFSKESAFIPNVFFDVSETIDLKIQALAKYQSELRDYPHPRSLQYLKELACNNGVRVGLKYSENFMLIRTIEK
ncbi:MAG: PIG-L family deacetylase [Elusimicrobiota bacterium]|jgi:LmbE family N-acetylglucosaminyl deacetylase|nr:PIG-L family deacetylase [Elusimicrobiota bacterium]